MGWGTHLMWWLNLMEDFGSSPPSLGREARSYDLLGRQYIVID